MKNLKILRVFLLLLTLCSTAFAANPSKPDKGVKGFFGGGYTYNVRENDHGFWIETGAMYKRFELSGGFFRMADAPWNYHEAQLMGRFNLSKTFSIEAGHGWGVICNPDTTCGAGNNIRTHTPIVGIMYRTPVNRRVDFIVRMDVTTHWQLPPTKGKDDGMPRFFVGVRFH